MAARPSSPFRSRRLWLLALTLSVLSGAAAAAAAEVSLGSGPKRKERGARIPKRERRASREDCAPLARFLQSDLSFSSLTDALLKTSELRAMERRSRQKGSAFVLLAPDNAAFPPNLLECLNWTDIDEQTVKRRKRLLLQMLRYLQIANLRFAVKSIADLLLNADGEDRSLKTVLGQRMIVSLPLRADDYTPSDDDDPRSAATIAMVASASDNGTAAAFIAKVTVLSANVSLIRFASKLLVPESIERIIDGVCRPSIAMTLCRRGGDSMGGGGRGGGRSGRWLKEMGKPELMDVSTGDLWLPWSQASAQPSIAGVPSSSSPRDGLGSVGSASDISSVHPPVGEGPRIDPDPDRNSSSSGVAVRGPSPPPPTDASRNRTSAGRGNKKSGGLSPGAIAGVVVVAGFVALAIGTGVAIVLVRRRNPRRAQGNQSGLEMPSRLPNYGRSNLEKPIAHHEWRGGMRR
ncbi:hypothetical protein CBR_g41311 [Chara braunii]|uniref:FAS1 domain-containing protein n=1 Tax=Chara braunii TaxID=69332 RepID=A0A388LVG2_CHABU|nr:hypothetical protein CBR_g41311 [Chara braunii]|eukprot:GBG86317.1 hypothetical protein CBR_g41311 [Chara braunii]